jgi:hypothetical protein
MQNIYFDFNGKTWSGYLLWDTAADAKYFWFVFNEDEMSEQFGDTIAFYIQGGRIMPVYQYTNKASFIEYLRRKIEAFLSAEQYSGKK